MSEEIELTFTSSETDTGTRLDRYLAETAARDDLSRSRVKQLIQNGHLTCNGAKISNPAASVKPDQLYHLILPIAVEAAPQAEDIPLDVLYEDEHLILVNKPVGLVVHPAPGSETGTLVNALMAHCGDSLSGIGGVMRPGIVHRLDKDTSGVMVAAKSEAAHQKLSKMFAKHDMDRRYQALIWGLPQARSGVVDAPLGRHKTDRKRQAVIADGRDARTHYSTLRDLPPFGALVECVLETGRTHQIRVHMAHIGHGLIGDPLYGRAPRAGQMPDRTSREGLSALRAFPRQALHAAILGFDHPITGQHLHFETDLPADMQSLLKQMEAFIARRATGG